MNAYGTFAVDSVIADAVNSQYPDEGPFGPRTTEERGCIVNIASAVAHPVPARCLTYGPTKSKIYPVRSSSSDPKLTIHVACVLGITGGMADFLGPYGIRVNSVSPAVVASALMGDRLVSPAITVRMNVHVHC